MSDRSKNLISEIQQNNRFMGTCPSPSCGEVFRLADAVMFSIKDNLPPEAVVAIDNKKQEFRDRKIIYKKQLLRLTTGAERGAAAVNLGNIAEEIIPSFSTFPYAPGDCRSLLNPIDYLVFSGLTKAAKIDSIIFVDVKTGSFRLNKREKEIKEIVQSGAVRFESHA